MAQQEGRSRDDPPGHAWSNPRPYSRHGEYDPPPPPAADNRLNRHHLPPPPNFNQNYSGYHQDAYQQHAHRPQDPLGRFVPPSPTMHSGPVHAMPPVGSAATSVSWDRHRSLAPTPVSLGVYARGDPALEGIPNYTRPRRTRTPNVSSAVANNSSAESLSYQPPPLHYQPPSDSPAPPHPQSHSHSISRGQLQQPQHPPSPYPPMLSPVRTSQPSPSSAAWTPMDAPWERRTPLIPASPSEWNSTSDRRRSIAQPPPEWVEDRARELPPLSRNWDRDHSRGESISSSPRQPPLAGEDAMALPYGHAPRYRRESDAYGSHPPTPRALPPTPNSNSAGGFRTPHPVSPYTSENLPYDEPPPMAVHDNGYLNRDRQRSGSYRLGGDPGGPSNLPPMEVSRRGTSGSHSRTSSITEVPPPPGYQGHRRVLSGPRAGPKTIVKSEPIDVDVVEPGEWKGSPAPGGGAQQRPTSESLETKYSLVTAANARSNSSDHIRTPTGGSSGMIHGLPSRPTTSSGNNSNSNKPNSAVGATSGITIGQHRQSLSLPHPQHHPLPPPPVSFNQQSQHQQPAHAAVSSSPQANSNGFPKRGVSGGMLMSGPLPHQPSTSASMLPMLPTPESSPTPGANGSWPSTTDHTRVTSSSAAVGETRSSQQPASVHQNDDMDVDKRNDDTAVTRSNPSEAPGIATAEPVSTGMEVDEQARRDEEGLEEEEVPKTRGRGRKRKAPRASAANNGNNNANGSNDDQAMDLDSLPDGNGNSRTTVRQGVLKYLRDNERLVNDADTSYDFIEEVFAQNRILVEAPCSRKRTTADDVVDEIAECPEIQSVREAYAEEDGVQVFLQSTVRKDHTEVTSKSRMLREQYRALNKEWEAHCLDLDRQIAAEKGLVTPIAPPLTPLVETPMSATTPAFPSRATRRSTAGNLGLLANAVRSEAEFEQIMATLGNEDLVDPNVLSIRNAANIPDMYSVLPLSTPLLDVKYDDNNGVVDYPEQFYDIHTAVGAWTEDEKEVYMEQFGVYGKQFGKIAGHLPYKSPEQCVLFYYLTKRGIVNFRDVVNKANGTRGKRKRGQLAKRSVIAPMMGKQKGNALLMDIRTRMDNDTPMDSPNNSPRQAEMEFSGPSRRRWNNNNTIEDSVTPTLQEGTAKSRAARAAARSKRVASRSSGDDNDTPARDSGDEATQSGPDTDAEAPTTETLAETAPAPPKRKHRRKIVQADDEAAASGEPPVKRRQRASSHWTTAEKATFVEQLTLVGRRWESISSVIKSKSATQCRNYFFSHMNEMGFAELAEQAETRLEQARQERSVQALKAKSSGTERGQRERSTSLAMGHTQNGYDHSGPSSRSMSHHEHTVTETPRERSAGPPHVDSYSTPPISGYGGNPQGWESYNGGHSQPQPQRQTHHEANGSMPSHGAHGQYRPTSSHSYGGSEAYNSNGPVYDHRSGAPVSADFKQGGTRLYFYSEHMYGNQQQPGANVPQRSSVGPSTSPYSSSHPGMRPTSSNDTNGVSRERSYATNGDGNPHTPSTQDSSTLGKPPAPLHVLPPFGTKPTPMHAHRRSGSQASIRHQSLDQQQLPEPKGPLMVID
ncbi:hypothetical protein FRB98_002231 [Tulasnella sp. 332]|nr:hypothetical protein FRB98_002231 [Tulasnella sp. 332]